MKKKFDLYEIITDRIICGLKKGHIPWQAPCVGLGENLTQPFNAKTKRPYHGINFVLANLYAMESGWKVPAYLTYKQAQELGGQVKKGEKGNPIVFWNFLKIEDKDTGEKKEIPFLKYYTVFNLEQIDGITYEDLGIEIKKPKKEKTKIKTNTEIENWLQSAKIYHDQAGRNFYSPTKDEIHLSKKEFFKSTTDYYSTALHELVHWTGHEKRLNRYDPTTFGTQKYSREELVAEIGSAFLCSHTDINYNIENTQAYINGWVQYLKEHKKEIVTASQRAQKAVSFITGKEAK